MLRANSRNSVFRFPFPSSFLLVQKLALFPASLPVRTIHKMILYTCEERAWEQANFEMLCLRLTRKYAVPIQHYMIQHNTTQHNMIQHNMTQHNATQHNVTQHDLTRHEITQHTTIQLQIKAVI